MDQTCLQACEAANFDEAMCMACEPTRPLLTFDGSTLASDVDPLDRATELARQHSKYTQGVILGYSIQFNGL